MIGYAVEMFMEDLLDGAARLCEETSMSNVTSSHLKEVVHSAGHLDFVRHLFQDVADFSEIRKVIMPFFAMSAPPL